ncbi:MAG: hypothetical protein WCO65_00640 [bacterium]
MAKKQKMPAFEMSIIGGPGYKDYQNLKKEFFLTVRYFENSKKIEQKIKARFVWFSWHDSNRTLVAENLQEKNLFLCGEIEILQEETSVVLRRSVEFYSLKKRTGEVFEEGATLQIKPTRNFDTKK